MIKWLSIDSDAIRRIGYDSGSETMYIDFEGSEVDTPFCNVPENLFKEFISSTSVTSFYEKNIKDTYSC